MISAEDGKPSRDVISIHNVVAVHREAIEPVPIHR
jgi:hypothetical protein